MNNSMANLYKIYDSKGYVRVKLKDGRIIECVADCFGETELEDETVVPDLRVEFRNGGSEILIEDDIEDVIQG